ncbi:MAG: DUF2804 domain-containing protein [Candidatus Dadabacteria bacterium]|nr:MAG: DUF2804 domain-containing protein [Candidatus Dadabacteria bacterium]
MEPQNQPLVVDGSVRFGRYDRPFPRVNLLEAANRLPRPVLRSRLKRWQAFQITSPGWFVNIALFHTGLLALAQVKAFDRTSQRKVLFERQLPPWAFDAPEQLLDSAMQWRGRGGSISFRNRLAQDRIEIACDVDVGKGERLTIDAVANASGLEPLVVAIPLRPGRAMYSQKGILPVAGRISCGDQQETWSEDDTALMMDDHRGFYGYVMRWDWLTTAVRQTDGSWIGLNLTRNASRDPQRYNENACWVDGRCHALPPVCFERSQTAGEERWVVRDDRGDVDLTFDVQVPGDLRLNALLIESRYRGPFGRINGVVRPAGADPVAFDDVFGMGEQFYLRV